MKDHGPVPRPPSGISRGHRGLPGVVGRWLRFSAGVVLLLGFIALLATVPPPGEVLRHNAEHDIQATALFYMDLDRMPEIERTLETMQQQAGQH